MFKIRLFRVELHLNGATIRRRRCEFESGLRVYGVWCRVEGLRVEGLGSMPDGGCRV